MTSLSILERTARTLRTLRGLRPIQVAARPWAVASRYLCGHVPGGAPPRLRGDWPAADPFLSTFARREAQRMRERVRAISPTSLLGRFERTYGYDVLDPTGADPRQWRDPVALHPFPAALRARNLALAARLGWASDARALTQAARAVLAQLELHLLGNHFLENAVGLACAGAVAAGPEADLWWRVGRAIITRELAEQFLPDGGHFELSASYHLALTSSVLLVVELAGAAGLPVPPSWRDPLVRALGWAAAVRAPDGTTPLFNDASLDAAPTVDDVLALGRATGIRPGAVGHDEARGDRRLSILADTGWVVLSQGSRAWLVFDAGADGASYQPGHVHADSLTFELWVDGARALVDYGVSSYEDDDARQATRATRSHNTVELAGHDSSEVWGAFRTGRRARARIIETSRKDTSLLVTAEHDGYRWLPGAPAHRRSLHLRENGLRIDDRVPSGHAARSTLRLDAEVAPAIRVERRGETAYTAPGDGEWFPRFAVARAARVAELHEPAGPERSIGWDLTWETKQ